MKKRRRFLLMLLVGFICLFAVQVHAEKEIPKESLEDAISARLKKAKELDLEKWVDEEGYLLNDFYVDKSDKVLEDMGVHELIRSVTTEELEDFVSCLNAGIANYAVTSYQKIQEGYDITGIFEVDGVLAYCIQHDVITPPAGSPTSTPVENTNDNLRKVMYYGYNGPASKGYSYVQTAMAASEANGVPAGNTGRRVLGEISVLPSPPKGFHVWVVHTNGGTSQDLAFYTFEKNGHAKVKKSSTDAELIAGNSCYSLERAVYGVYSDADCKNQVVLLTTKANGESDAKELPAGTYYVKETIAPSGFALSKEVKEIQVTAEQTTVITMSDIPQVSPMKILLEKADAETKEKRAQGSATLEGAEFTVKFYKGEYEEKEDPASKGKLPDREWIFRTDQKGVIQFSEEYKVSGDTFWTDTDGNAVLPLGTVTIQEIKAPEGYHLNSEVFVQKITGMPNMSTAQSYQKVLVEENILKLNLIKRQEGTELVIPNAEFEHTKPDGTKERLKTDENGELIFKGLQHGVHQIKEISVMDGYVVNENILDFTVSETNEITLQSTIEESFGKTEFQVTEDGNVIVEMEDRLTPFCLAVHKENSENVILSGAEFTLYEDEGCTNKVNQGMTNEKGILEFANLEIGKTYYLKETKAPEGYRLPSDLFGNPVVYELRTESSPVNDEFIFYVDEKAYVSNSDERFYVTGTKANPKANVVVINKPGVKLPETGSVWMIPLLATGEIMCGFAFVIRKRRKEYEK